MNDIVQCAEYVNENVTKIAENVNKKFYRDKDYIKKQLIMTIQSFLSPIPVHYYWVYDGCPYDYSGILVKDGFVSLEQTVDEFLSCEYSGNKESTYISRFGFSYNSYGDELSYVTLDIGIKIMDTCIREQIENHFRRKISEEELECIREECNNFDDIYINCLASEFFSYEVAIAFVDIGKLMLNEIEEII